MIVFTTLFDTHSFWDLRLVVSVTQVIAAICWKCWAVGCHIYSLKIIKSLAQVSTEHGSWILACRRHWRSRSSGICKLLSAAGSTDQDGKLWKLVLLEMPVHLLGTLFLTFLDASHSFYLVLDII